MKWSRASLLLVCLALLSASAWAAFPPSYRITRAVADTNRAAGRGTPLLLNVSLRIDDAAPSAEGELAIHPKGLARLELRNDWGFVERHLLQGDAYQASRDGEPLNNPHPFLPPLFLLQASSGEALSAALASYGVAERRVELGHFGPHDCYVIGGRIPAVREAGQRPRSESLLPALWVDMKGFEPVRIVRADGVEYRLGPLARHGKIRVPEWIEIGTPEGFRARLEVTRATRADAPAALFQPAWLADVPSAPALD